MRGLVSDIQKFSLHDGPGIRTTIFLKGCTLACQWCHNPEAISLKLELMHAPEKCIGCGACVKVCPTCAQILVGGQRRYVREKCRQHLHCAEVCPSGALTVAGRWMEGEEVFSIAMADQPYHEASCGGITLSGGDPVAQPDFSQELLVLFQKAGVHTAMESALNASRAVVDRLAAHLDLLYCDLKLQDESAHIAFTGASNRLILANIARLASAPLSMVIRTPLVPGITDTPENIRAIARWLAHNAPDKPWQLLNYNPMAQAKWENLGLAYPPGGLAQLSSQAIDSLVAIAREEGAPCFYEQE